MNERTKAEEFTRRLRDLYGPDLVASVLYGSAARGEYRAGRSDLNLLVVVERLGYADLKRAAPLAREWADAGNPPPLMLSRSEWLGSADVFALEYSDIREAHILLAGEDLFAGLHIQRRDLRFQVEHELRSRKIQLREGLLAAAGDPVETAQLLLLSLSTFLTLFRAVLRLADQQVPRGGPALIDLTAELVKFDAHPVHAVRAARDQVAAGDPVDLDEEITAGYLAAVERTADWLETADGGEIRPDGEI